MAEEAGGKEEEHVKAAGRFRTALPQVLASTAKNMILLDLGMTVAFPTIVIPALHNTADPLCLNDEETSWFGSIAYICQPLGSILSGIVLEHLGRKKSMILVNFPHMLGWCLFYFANSVPMLYASSVIMGLGVGFMEAPIITYVGEISQPELRGILTSYAGIFVQMGFILEYLLGTISTWRKAALISAVVPVITVIAITQVPETPIWLLSKGRVKDAEKALCWLRGWVPPSAVKKEFDELVQYSENNKNSKKAGNEGGGGLCIRKTRLILEPQTLRPLFLVIMFFFFQHWSGLSAMRPYMVQVLEEFGVPLDAHWTTVISGVIGLIGNIVCMVGVPYMGKRPISLVSMAASSMSCILLGGYAYAVLSPGDVATGSSKQVVSWLPMFIFIVLVFMQSVGVLPVPWMILSEVFPFRSRGLASGIAAAASYILAFVASKTFLALKTDLQLHGVFFLYGVLAIVGFLLIYFTFSETEGRSLEDIEEFYRKGIRGNIPKLSIQNTDTKQNSISPCSAINVTLVDRGHTNIGFSSNEEDRMINSTLFEGHTPDGMSKSNNEESRPRALAADTTFIENRESKVASETEAPQVPKKRKSTKTNEVENDHEVEQKNNKEDSASNNTANNMELIEKLDDSASVNCKEIVTNENKQKQQEVIDEFDKEETRGEETGKIDSQNVEIKQKNGNKIHVHIIHEKAEIHSDPEVESRTRM